MVNFRQWKVLNTYLLKFQDISRSVRLIAIAQLRKLRSRIEARDNALFMAVLLTLICLEVILWFINFFFPTYMCINEDFILFQFVILSSDFLIGLFIILTYQIHYGVFPITIIFPKDTVRVRFLYYILLFVLLCIFVVFLAAYLIIIINNVLHVCDDNVIQAGVGIVESTHTNNTNTIASSNNHSSLFNFYRSRTWLCKFVDVMPGNPISDILQKTDYQFSLNKYSPDPHEKLHKWAAGVDEIIARANSIGGVDSDEISDEMCIGMEEAFNEDPEYFKKCFPECTMEFAADGHSYYPDRCELERDLCPPTSSYIGREDMDDEYWEKLRLEWGPLLED